MTHEERLREIVKGREKQVLAERSYLHDASLMGILTDSPWKRTSSWRSSFKEVHDDPSMLHSALFVQYESMEDPKLGIIGFSEEADVLNKLGIYTGHSADFYLTGRFGNVAREANIDGKILCHGVEAYGDIGTNSQIESIHVGNSSIHGDVGYQAEGNIHVYQNSRVQGDVACEGCYIGVEVRNSRVNGDVARNAEITTDYFHVTRSSVEGSIGHNTSTETLDERI